MIKELENHGYEVSPGTMYPILHALEREGFLKSRKENVQGKIRKYYRITGKGQKILTESRKKVSELTREIMV
jgi:PadR family transcriptional regulator PadR